MVRKNEAKRAWTETSAGSALILEVKEEEEEEEDKEEEEEEEEEDGVSLDLPNPTDGVVTVSTTKIRPPGTRSLAISQIRDTWKPSAITSRNGRTRTTA